MGCHHFGASCLKKRRLFIEQTAFFSFIINAMMSHSVFKRSSFLSLLGQWIPLLLRLSVVLLVLWGVFSLGQWVWQSLQKKPTASVVHPIAGKAIEISTTLGEDERALLLLRSAAFLLLLQQQSYGQLYDTWAGETLKQVPESRPTFLKMAYCSERFLGKMVAYNKGSVVVVKVVKPALAYHVVVQTEREKANASEKLVLLPYGLDYRWVGYYVASPNADFQACLRTITHPRKLK